MQPFTFNPGPRLISGNGTAVRLAEVMPDGPCLFVTDQDVLRLGLTDACRSALEQAGREMVLFDAVEADPSKGTLLAAVELGRRHDVTHVIGFGGGSPMDVAKLAAYLLGSGEELDEIWGVDIAKGQRLPLALVPTTAGTGSEATPISVITCEGGTKLAVNARPLVADWAVLDASLTLGLPAHVTAATGIDAIVHSVEAYTSARLKNPLSDSLAREALRLLAGNLLKAIEDPRNVETRSAMLLGAHLAGLAFANAPVAGVHALAYPLGGIHHLPHGLSNALMLRVVLQHNSEAARELAGYGCPTRMHVVRLLAPQLTREDHTKDIDFSPSGIMQRWDAGYRHTKAVLERKPWVGEFDPLSGVVLHEQLEAMPEAAE